MWDAMLSHEKSSAWSSLSSSSSSRPAFRRRQTLASFPESSSLIGSIDERPLTSDDKTASSTSCSAASKNDSEVGGVHALSRPARPSSARQLQRVRSPTSPGSAASQPAGVVDLLAESGSRTRRQQPQQQGRLSGDGGHSAGLGGTIPCDQRSSFHRRLGRTPSSPSVLFSRVKERIREKVFETSAEWPHMAAIERERRQRAAQAFELSLRGRRLSARHHNQRGNHLVHQGSASSGVGGGAAGSAGAGGAGGGGSGTVSRQPSGSSNDLPAGGVEVVLVGGAGEPDRRRVRIRSDPSRRSVASDSREDEEDAVKPAPYDKDSARLAFRRRSISEDTYNRAPPKHPPTSSSIALAASGDSSKRGSGVVCSNDDLKAIVCQHKLRRSPVVSPTATAGSGTVSGLDRTDASLISLGADEFAVHQGGGSSWSVEVQSSGSTTWFETSRPSSIHQTDELTSPGRFDAVVSSGMTPTIHEQDSFEQDSSSLMTSPTVGDVDVGQSQYHRQQVSTSNLAGEPATPKTPTPVPDVVFDEHGQTWDVYGAEFDPEILGQAIQSYLEKIIRRKKTMTEAAGGRNGARIEDDDGSGGLLDTDDGGQLHGKDSPCLYGNQSSGNGPRTHIDRGVRFLMRYLCSSSTWRHNEANSPGVATDIS